MTYEWTVRGLAIAVEAKDEYTGGHLQRVSRYGMAITAVVAPDHDGDPQFEYGFLLHDVGKLVVPDAILIKEGPLNEQEWAIIRAHSEAGRTILERIPFLSGATEIVYAPSRALGRQGLPEGTEGRGDPARCTDIPAGGRLRRYDHETALPGCDLGPRHATRAPEGIGDSKLCPSAVEAFMGIATEDLDAMRSEVRRESSR